MTSSVHESKAQKIWFDQDNMWVQLFDGRQLSVPLAFFPRLLHATESQRADFQVSGGGTGIHWDTIDEDISVAGLLLGYGDQTISIRKVSASH